MLRSAGHGATVYGGAGWVARRSGRLEWYHGFVRTADGVITTFGATGGGTGPTQGTLGYSIDSAGAVAGFRYGTNKIL